jgi:hypothetical protein
MAVYGNKPYMSSMNSGSVSVVTVSLSLVSTKTSMADYHKFLTMSPFFLTIEVRKSLPYQEVNYDNRKSNI